METIRPKHALYIILSIVGIVVLLGVVWLFTGRGSSHWSSYTSASADYTSQTTRTYTEHSLVSAISVNSRGGNVTIDSTSANTTTVVEVVHYGATPPSASTNAPSVSNGTLSVATSGCNNNNCHIDYRITVPASVSPNVQSSGGSVTLSGLSASDTNLSTAGGSVAINKLTSPTVTLDTNGGDVAIDGLTANNTSISSDGGEIAAKQLRSPNITFDTGGGDVAASSVQSGNLSVSSNGGNVSLSYVSVPDSVNVETDGGNITLALPGSASYGIAESTDGGSYAAGNLSINTSSSKRLNLSSGGGDIVLGSN